MPKLIKNKRILVFLLIIFILIIVVIYCYRTTNNELIVPTEEEVVLNGYPENENGDTYGPAIENMFPPDLMLAIGEDNIQGYVKLSESAGKVAESPEEAEALNKSTKAYSVPLYLQDGKTVIGKFILVPNAKR